ncbi:MAG: hypothetical protein A2653_00750 [Candidatus Zambryskibacteria bacterium RIFCSPHIGHO2_01_FULL_43_25]|uniref:Adenylate kinase n=1 Tax=Candidatus Zambryskibacteria bacterium RIFCSPLOWO2_01_FULL_45_21 TaxID=1802761 RepID=A0A1G2U4K5_9BACT|nr:MAG: hypothetical protein A2653_00750 [Candidatus Zambryskibacteria bacterium RIFCSPHIGHO2_01_FULL_43_25]OHB00841.1 MAG: hypothetical protein A3E94_00675 [Candidatus Zambryskibacteria bacterium RIFCSPHIGHO2_12_FULL_44_12b]OHB04433.1 MAG: hypothetical protein A3B14_03275 [Candidatus Zambryskibacteria bacterium RIFCSPLOWO2_01_FULL_45_21]
MSPKTFIFIGRSGCGKGTQSHLLQEYISKKDNRKIVYIETGLEFREFIKNDGYSNKLSHEVYDRDERQPGFLACYMWTKALLNNFTGEQNLFFDGALRSLPEARLFETVVNFYKLSKAIVIFIDVSREWSEMRLMERGRSDDLGKEKIAKRLDWFEKDTLPALDFLRASGCFNFVRINGEQTIEEVHQEIVNSVGPLLE